MVFSPSVFLSRETYTWSDFVAVAGGRSPQSPSISASVETTFPAFENEHRENASLLGAA